MKKLSSPLCMLCTVLQIRSVRGLCYIESSTDHCLRLYTWLEWVAWEVFPHMGGGIVYEWASILPAVRIVSVLYDFNVVGVLFLQCVWACVGCLFPSYAEAGCIIIMLCILLILHYELIKTPFIGEKTDTSFFYSLHITMKQRLDIDTVFRINH